VFASNTCFLAKRNEATPMSAIVVDPSSASPIHAVCRKLYTNHPLTAQLQDCVQMLLPLRADGIQTALNCLTPFGYHQLEEGER